MQMMALNAYDDDDDDGINSNNDSEELANFTPISEKEKPHNENSKK